MTKKSKAIAAIISLVCVCIACIWLSPYISYMLTLSAVSHATQGHVHCWIKVIDQDGNGVQGYKLEITEHATPPIPFLFKGTLLKYYDTDSKGIIDYDSKRPVGELIVHSDTQWKLNPRYLTGQGFEIREYKLKRAMEKDPVNYLGSKSNPYILRVFSVGPPQRLLYWDKPARLKNKHDWVCVDILSGHLWESKAAEGDIAVRDNNRFTPENPKGYCSRSFLAGPQCSIYPVVDDWGLRPPLKGYRKELCCTRDWLALRKQTYNQTEIYYRLAVKGRYIYGRLLLFGSGRASDSLYRCYTNLQGHRDLYFKGYERSVMHPWIWKMEDYVKPPVNPADLFPENGVKWVH